jgi:tRNA dimethylallyltransferase
MTIRRSVVVLGPTASGKSDAAMTAAALQPKGSVHVIVADSMQVYKRMDIGTAKPSAADQALIPHHCLDVAEPNDRHTVAHYVENVAAARLAISDADASELIVGGTGLYVTAIVDGLDMPSEYPEIRAALEANEDTEAMFAQLLSLDPEATTKMDPNNRRRLIRALEVCLGSGEKFSSFGEGIGSYSPTSTTLIGLRWDRDVLRARIAQRVNIMMERGLVEEVRALLAEPNGLAFTARQALGYKEMIEHLEGRWSLNEAVAATILRTQQFAIRQDRWFRRDPRIQWVDVHEDPIEEVTPVVTAALE